MSQYSLVTIANSLRDCRPLYHWSGQLCPPMMVVCSRSRVKPKGSPFELLPFFISSSRTGAGDVHPPCSLPAWRIGGWTGFGQWRKGTTEGYGERLYGLHLLPAFSAFFLLTWEIENPMWKEKKCSFCDGLMASLDSVGAIKSRDHRPWLMHPSDGSCSWRGLPLAW